MPLLHYFLAQKEVLKLERKESTKVDLKCTLNARE